MSSQDRLIDGGAGVTATGMDSDHDRTVVGTAATEENVDSIADIRRSLCRIEEILDRGQQLLNGGFKLANPDDLVHTPHVDSIQQTTGSTDRKDNSNNINRMDKADNTSTAFSNGSAPDTYVGVVSCNNIGSGNNESDVKEISLSAILTMKSPVVHSPPAHIRRRERVQVDKITRANRPRMHLDPNALSHAAETSATIDTLNSSTSNEDMVAKLNMMSNKARELNARREKSSQQKQHLPRWLNYRENAHTPPTRMQSSNNTNNHTAGVMRNNVYTRHISQETADSAIVQHQQPYAPLSHHAMQIVATTGHKGAGRDLTRRHTTTALRSTGGGKKNGSISARGRQLALASLQNRPLPNYEEGVDPTDLPQNISIEELKTRIHQELEDFYKRLARRSARNTSGRCSSNDTDSQGEAVARNTRRSKEVNMRRTNGIYHPPASSHMNNRNAIYARNRAPNSPTRYTHPTSRKPPVPRTSRLALTNEAAAGTLRRTASHNSNLMRTGQRSGPIYNTHAWNSYFNLSNSTSNDKNNVAGNKLRRCKSVNDRMSGSGRMLTYNNKESIADIRRLYLAAERGTVVQHPKPWGSNAKIQPMRHATSSPVSAMTPPRCCTVRQTPRWSTQLTQQTPLQTSKTPNHHAATKVEHRTSAAKPTQLAFCTNNDEEQKQNRQNNDEKRCRTPAWLRLYNLAPHLRRTQPVIAGNKTPATSLNSLTYTNGKLRCTTTK